MGVILWGWKISWDKAWEMAYLLQCSILRDREIAEKLGKRNCKRARGGLELTIAKH